MSVKNAGIEDVERSFGAQVRALRLAQDIDQKSLAAQANVSLTALQGLEAGRGSSLRTVIRIVRALGREDWLLDLYPEPAVSPLAVVRAQQGLRTPQRASRPPKRKS